MWVGGPRWDGSTQRISTLGRDEMRAKASLTGTHFQVGSEQGCWGKGGWRQRDEWLRV